MPVFENCSVVLEVKDLPFKEKKKLKLAITDNGGSISYVVNKQCTHIVTNNLDNVSSNRQRSIQKFQVPVVGVQYVFHCLEKGTLLSTKEYSPDALPPTVTPPPSSQTVFKVTGHKHVEQRSRFQPQPPTPVLHSMMVEKEPKSGTYLGNHRVYSDNDSDLPTFPSNFEVAKYSIFEKESPSSNWVVLELQTCKGLEGQQYRVVRYWSEGQGPEAAVTRDKLVYCSKSEEALEVYEMLEKELRSRNLTQRMMLPPQPQGLGSTKLLQLLLEEKLSSSAISQEVGVFVELLWTEALGCLGNILKTPITSISLNDVSRAEGLLLQVQKGLKEGAELEQLLRLMGEFYTLLPHKVESTATIKIISQKLDLCQLIRDMLKVSEATMWSPTPSCLGKYHALRCSIECVPPDSPECHTINALLLDRPVQIQRVFRVSRPGEVQVFRGELGNVRPLLHSSSPSSFVGILSRGLLLPRTGVEHHGIERTDIGNLGSGIYFSDSMSTSMKYSKPGVTDGTRLLLVCDVALGQCKDLQRRDVSLSCAPEGYHSVHGVRRSPTLSSDFEDDEYVVYHTDQVQLKYVVQFSVEDDPVKVFQPSVKLSLDTVQPASTSDLLSESEEDSVGAYKNPLEEMTAGLQDSTGQPLPLKAVDVKCKLMDLLTQVIIFQTYTNLSEVPIEAKYVFPLDESAAVCGFEAFINGKHVVGQVKEKEQARKEYRQAIERGHGAYLMDQDAPDVFTISVGNLPPAATVLIKVTYVTELLVKAGSLLFSLPGSVAPWQQSKALNQRTQVSVEKVCVNELQTEGCFTLDMSIEMPYEILDLHCVTHRVKIKKTECKAVVSTLPGQTLGPDGFQLSFTLSQIHLPRMWVENHPDKDSQACMLVFYPHFDSSGVAGSGDEDEGAEVVILLDTSESMRGAPVQNARRIAVQALKSLDHKVRVNLFSFGTDHKELFLSSQPCSTAFPPAMKFAMTSPPMGGSTDLWKPLRSLNLLPPSRGIRNLLLISDGHIQSEGLTLQLIRENIQHSRVFTCGVSPTANRHMLRALAQAGGGAYEFFDTKMKHTWVEKVSSQVRRMCSPGCSALSVKWQQFNPLGAPPIQAPTQLHALFSDCHTLVYGFVPHCTQATLSGKLSEQEIEMMVSTTELQKTKGTLLHKLTARAVIRDYEDGSLHADQAEHEGRKEELKSYIIELSKEYSIVTQYTSFVAIEERDTDGPSAGFTDIPRLIAEEDVDFLPYISWGGEVTDNVMDDDSFTADQEDEVFGDLLSLHEVSRFNKCSSVSSDTAIDPADADPLETMDYGGSLYARSIFRSGKRLSALLVSQGAPVNPDLQRHRSSKEQLMSLFDSPEGSKPDTGSADVDLSERSSISVSSADKSLLSSSFKKGERQLQAPASPPYPPPPSAGPGVPLRKEKSSKQVLQHHECWSLPICSAPTPLPPSLLAAPGGTLSPPPPLPIRKAAMDNIQSLICDDALLQCDEVRHVPPPPFLPLQTLHMSRAPTEQLPVDNQTAGFGATASAGYSFGAPAAESALPPPPPPAALGVRAAATARLFGAPALMGAPPPPPPQAALGVSAAASAASAGFSFGATAAKSGPVFGSSGSFWAPSRATVQHKDTLSQGAVPHSMSIFGTGAKPTFSFGSASSDFGFTRGCLAINVPPAPPDDTLAGLFGVTPSPSPPLPIREALMNNVQCGVFQLPPSSVNSVRATATLQSDGVKHVPPGIFGSASSAGFLFGAPAAKSAPPPPPPPAALGVSTAASAGFLFGAPAAKSAPPPPPPQAALGVSAASAKASAGFSFGAPAPKSGPVFGSSGSFWAPSRATVQHKDTLSQGAVPQSMSIFGTGAKPTFSFGSASSDFGFTRGCLAINVPPAPPDDTLAGLFSHAMDSAPVEHSFSSEAEMLQDNKLAKEKQPRREEKITVRLNTSFREGRRSHGVSWAKLFDLQHQDGYWECTERLGSLLHLDIDFFANVFLKEKGIKSLGARAHADILRLVATLLVLQLMRVMGLAEGSLLRTLFHLEEAPAPKWERWEAVKRAVKWVSQADRQYPCVCSRLEFGRDWESATRQLLGVDPLHPYSPLHPILERSAGIQAQ